MKEKSEQEQRAAERQVELISDALNSAKDNAGFWMNQGRLQFQAFQRDCSDRLWSVSLFRDL